MSEAKRLPRAFYIILGIAVLTLITGFTLGALTLGSFSSAPHQATVSSLAPSAPAGLTFPFVGAAMVEPTGSPSVGECTASNLGTELSPTALVDKTNSTVCLSAVAGGFSLGDLVYLFDISWNSSAATHTIFEIQLFVSVVPSTHDVLLTSYVNTTATIAASPSAPEIATFTLDLTAGGDSAVAGYNIIVSQLGAVP